MRRDEGFTHADIAANALHHPRLRKLRAQHGELEASALTLIWLELVLASWLEGDRLDLEQIEPPATLTDERRQSLRDAGLVDAHDRVPAKAWQAWYGPASDRAARRRNAGRKGAQTRWQSDGNADADAKAMRSHMAPQSVSNGNPIPVSQSGSARSTSALSDDSTRARAAGGPAALEVNPRYRNGAPGPISEPPPEPTPWQPEPPPDPDTERLTFRERVDRARPEPKRPDELF